MLPAMFAMLAGAEVHQRAHTRGVDGTKSDAPDLHRLRRFLGFCRVLVLVSWCLGVGVGALFTG